jgi:hypothetical protein
MRIFTRAMGGTVLLTAMFLLAAAAPNDNEATQNIATDKKRSTEFDDLAALSKCAQGTVKWFNGGVTIEYPTSDDRAALGKRAQGTVKWLNGGVMIGYPVIDPAGDAN